MLHLQVTDKRKVAEMGPVVDANQVGMTSDEYKWHWLRAGTETLLT
jgi:hypothetical protein